MKYNTICKIILIHCSESLSLEQRTEVLCPVLFHTQAISKIINNQIALSQYGYIYFMWDHLHSALNTSAHCSRYQDLLLCTSIIVKILLYCMFHTYWLMYCLPDDLWMMETCWRFDVYNIKLHTGIVYVVGYIKIVCQIMHRINNNNNNNNNNNKHISQSF